MSLQLTASRKQAFLTVFIAVIAIVTTVLVLGFFLTQRTPTAQAAASGKDFDAGHIIDDNVFYNDRSMDASRIQAFLNSKVPSCDTNGTKPASDWGHPEWTHAQFASYKREGSHGLTKDTGFHKPPYTCLKDYKQNTPSMEAASGLCGGLSAKTNRTAAQIIKDISSACNINPQVLIVLLQKEQTLVTDNWPLKRQYNSATGFDCPDSAPCDPAYAGFFYQVYYAARQFQIYKAHPNDYNYRAGRTNRIYWNPDLSRCGSSQVYIENQATAALYIYTPYRPNKAALDNLYGTGDSCSSYGNRNFWRLFTDWFGSTKEIFSQYKYENLVGTSAVIQNNSLNAGDTLSAVTIGSKIYNFYSDKTTGTLRFSYWNGTKWTDTALDGPGSTISGAFSTALDIGAIETFIYKDKPQVFFYEKTSHTLRHAYTQSNGAWKVETLDGIASGAIIDKARDVGAAIKGFTYGKQDIQLFYYNASGDNLEHTWWDGNRWRNESLDGTAGGVIKRTVDVGSVVSAIKYQTDLQLFYYNKDDGELVHTWWSDKDQKWSTEKMDGDTGAVLRNAINAGKKIETTVHYGKLFVAYYDDATGFSGRTSAWRIAYWSGREWIQNTLDGGTGSRTNSSTAVPFGDITLSPYNNESLQIFYKNSSLGIRHFWIKR